jgi:hypothetical protein
MGNVCDRIMNVNSRHDRIFFEEVREPSTCPNEFRSELHDFGGPLQGKSLYTARWAFTVFLFLLESLVVCCRPGNACT